MHDRHDAVDSIAVNNPSVIDVWLGSSDSCCSKEQRQYGRLHGNERGQENLPLARYMTSIAL